MQIDNIIEHHGFRRATLIECNNNSVTLSFVDENYAIWHLIGTELGDKFYFNSCMNVCAAVCRGGRWSCAKTDCPF